MKSSGVFLGVETSVSIVVLPKLVILIELDLLIVSAVAGQAELGIDLQNSSVFVIRICWSLVCLLDTERHITKPFLHL